MAQNQRRARTQMVRLFLDFVYIWQKYVAKISQVTKAPAQYKSGPGNSMIEQIIEFELRGA